MHPFLFVLFPPLSLLSANLSWASPREVFFPACVLLGIAVTLWLLLWPLLPDPRKRGLAISLTWIPFFGYGGALDAARRYAQTQAMLGSVELAGAIVIVLIVAIAAMLLLRRSHRTFVGATKALNRFAAVLVLVAFASCATTLLRQMGNGADFLSKPGELVAVKQGTDLPDIYFILCDAYPRADYLQDYFGYDNRPFLDGLRKRGFFVAKNSRSNYPNTLPSLASTFNLDYLDNALATEGWDGEYPQLLDLIRDNAAVRQLKSAGYEYVVPASGLFPRELPTADRFIHPGDSPYTEYQQRLIDMTPIRSVMNRLKKERWHHRVPFVLDTLENLERDKRPMFVYAHLLAPHLPHSYDADGRILTTIPPYKEGWRQVTTFINRRLLEVVDRILARNPNSVIIVQGDHGPNTSWQDGLNMVQIPWAGAWDQYVRDRTANLCAWYLPGGQYEGILKDNMTPVNTFRILFNRYLATNYEMLGDVTYLSPQSSAEIVRVEGGP